MNQAAPHAPTPLDFGGNRRRERIRPRRKRRSFEDAGRAKLRATRGRGEGSIEYMRALAAPRRAQVVFAKRAVQRNANAPPTPRRRKNGLAPRSTRSLSIRSAFVAPRISRTVRGRGSENQPVVTRLNPASSSGLRGYADAFVPTCVRARPRVKLQPRGCSTPTRN